MTLMRREQLKALRMRYHDIKDDLDYSDPPRDWNTATQAEMFFPDVVRAAVGTPLNPFLFGFYTTQPRPEARMQISGTTD